MRSIVREIGTTASEYVRSDIDAVLQDDAAGVQLHYTLASEQSAFSINRSAPTIYERSQILIRDTDRLSYGGGASGELGLGQPGPNFGSLPRALRYVFTVRNAQSETVAPGLSLERRYVTGTPTLPPDIPGSGSFDHRSILLVHHVAPSGVSGPFGNGDFQIDFGTRAAAGTISATAGNGQDQLRSVTLTFTGQLDRQTGRLCGNITSPEGFAGLFVGRLYGPAGGEFGVGFMAARGAERMVGTLIVLG